MGAWQTVYEIAERREGTKQGNGHLTKKRNQVIEFFHDQEMAELVRSALSWPQGS